MPEQSTARKFKVGDYVNWTNSNGVNLGKRKVIGLDTWVGDSYISHRCFLDPIDTPWYPVNEDCLEMYDPAKHELKAH